MTEKSWLWTGTATGDASLAPYADAAFNHWLVAAHSLDADSKIYILPGYLDDLLVEPSAGSAYSALIVRPGVCVFKNYVYFNDADLYFAINPLVSYPTATNYRYDSLVLRLDREAQTVTLALLVGQESASFPPTAPALTQTDYEIYETELARVLVDSTTFTIEHADIESFARYLPSPTQTITRPNNLVHNHEMMSFFAVTGSAPYPTAWATSGIIAAESAAAVAIAPQTRGWAWQLIDIETTDYVYMWVPLPLENPTGNLNVATYEGLFNLANSTVIVDIAFLFYDGEGNYIPSENVGLRLRGSGVHRPRKTFRLPVGAKTAQLKLSTSGTTNSFDIGQQLLSVGYFTGGIRTQHSMLFRYYHNRDTSWDGDAKSTGSTTVNTVVSFGGNIPSGTKALILSVAARDSGSAASVPAVAIYNTTGAQYYGSLSLGGLPNDYIISRQITAWCDEAYSSARTATHGFTVVCNASGAGTLDVWIKIVGTIV